MAAALVAATAASGRLGPAASALGIASPVPVGATARPTAVATGAGDVIPPGYRLTVSRLGIDLPIAEGVIARDVTAQQTPEGYAFHLPGTSIPGGPGNTYLYSHARPGMFLSLWNARVGDLVLITTPGGTRLRYLVTEVDPRVPPTDVAVAQQTTDERLTLQTSTGPAPDDPRFVVIAQPLP